MPLIDPSTGQPDASGVMVNVNIKSYALANYAGMPAGAQRQVRPRSHVSEIRIDGFRQDAWPGIHPDRHHAAHRPGHAPVAACPGTALHRADGRPVLIDANDGVAYLGIHIGLVAAAFMLAEHNRFVVLKKW